MNTGLEKNPIRILGLMTGTSADGLDICLVEFSGGGFKPDYEIIYSSSIKYPAEFSITFRNPLELSERAIARLDDKLGQWLAIEIAMLNLKFDLISSHGQTIKHEPPCFTLQIGNPKYMANTFNVPVIYDFRSGDIEAGGQGAPLIPIVDKFIFQQEDTDVLCLNIGGISNITIVPSEANSSPLLAWDTGPGNTLIDKAVELYSNGSLLYDLDGRIAAEGVLNKKLLALMLKHEFYSLAPPRSAGQEQFGQTYFKEILNFLSPKRDQEFKDLIFTLTVLTAKTISKSIAGISSEYNPKGLFASGGGIHNKTLWSLLEDELPGLDLQTVGLKNINADNKEAFGFAYLGYLHARGLAGNIPSVTGANRELVLGRLFPPDN